MFKLRIVGKLFSVFFGLIFYKTFEMDWFAIKVNNIDMLFPKVYLYL